MKIKYDVILGDLREKDEFYKINNEKIELKEDTTDYDLEYEPIKGSLQVYINGLYNQEGDNYTIDGKTISFETPISYLDGHTLSVKYLY